MHPFINRQRELSLLEKLKPDGGLIALFGRRRVGKSRLLREWFAKIGGHYSQAIEGAAGLQLEQLYHDIAPGIATKVTPASWEELFELIEHERSSLYICIDEFPYLVTSDPTLPSRIQRWFDKVNKKNLLLVLAGSSRRMMDDIFLNANAPLYGRAQRIIQLEPMSYEHFCEALKLKPHDLNSFLKFSLVGGIPKYWELMKSAADVVATADDLYFDFAPFMQNEPRRILRDEKLDDLNPMSVLEAIGRGATRPSEIAGRMQSKQQNLSRVFEHLARANLVLRDIPFGSNVRDVKHVLYKIVDPALRFWYKVYSPHQSLWSSYSTEYKRELIYGNASTLFEDHIRARFPGAGRYWETNLEIDLVAPLSTTRKDVMIGEIKFTKLNTAARKSLKTRLEERWRATKVAGRYRVKEYRIFDIADL